jgi:hypothetical protein
MCSIIWWVFYPTVQAVLGVRNRLVKCVAHHLHPFGKPVSLAAALAHFVLSGEKSRNASIWPSGGL